MFGEISVREFIESPPCLISLAKVHIKKSQPGVFSKLGMRLGKMGMLLGMLLFSFFK